MWACTSDALPSNTLMGMWSVKRRHKRQSQPVITPRSLVYIPFGFVVVQINWLSWTKEENVTDKRKVVGGQRQRGRRLIFTAAAVTMLWVRRVPWHLAITLWVRSSNIITNVRRVWVDVEEWPLTTLIINSNYLKPQLAQIYHFSKTVGNGLYTLDILVSGHQLSYLCAYF